MLKVISVFWIPQSSKSPSVLYREAILTNMFVYAELMFRKVEKIKLYATLEEANVAFVAKTTRKYLI